FSYLFSLHYCVYFFFFFQAEDGIRDLIVTGVQTCALPILVVAALVAALVGLISFLSPCVLPLVPGYLSYVTGLAGTQAGDGEDRSEERRVGKGCRCRCGWDDW